MVSQWWVVAANEIERLVGAFDRASERPYKEFGTINPISIEISVIGPYGCKRRLIDDLSSFGYVYGVHLLESLVPSKLSK